MKKILMLVAIACAFVNAQVNYVQGTPQTQQPAYYTADQLPPGAVVVVPQSTATPVETVSAPAPVNYSDSASYYDNLADNFYKMNVAGKSNGTAKIAVGAIGLGIGLVSLIVIMADEDDFCDEVYVDNNNYNCETNGAGTLLMLGGSGFAITGGVFLGLGIKNKMQYNRAVRYVNKLRDKADLFRRMLSEVYIVPEVDPFNKTYGAKLAYNF